MVMVSRVELSGSELVEALAWVLDWGWVVVLASKWATLWVGLLAQALVQGWAVGLVGVRARE